MRNTLGEREYDKFVDSPTRSGKSAVEVLVANDINVNLDGIASQEKQDEQTAELQSINSELQTLNANDFSTLAEQQIQSTILNSIYARLLLILNAILGVLNIRPLTFLTDKVDASGSSVSVSNFPASQNVVVTSSALPTGASTSALQTAGNSILSNILSAIQGVLNIRNLVFANDKVDVTGSTVNVGNFPATQNVNVVSSVLPTGAATAANQTTANSILSNILAAIQGVLNIRFLTFANDKVDVSGSTITAQISGFSRLNTYSASAVDFIAANVATDIFTISGSATKKIKITHISVNGVQQNISRVQVLLIKRSTLNVGGTSTVRTNIPHSSLNPAATATVQSYSANPTTLGTSVGTIQAERVTIGSANGANVATDDLRFEFGHNDNQEIILENINESLAVNLNGVTLSNNLMTIDISWVEV